jgi:hypothetical protein
MSASVAKRVHQIEGGREELRVKNEAVAGTENDENV